MFSVVLPLRSCCHSPRRNAQRGLGEARRVSAEHRAVSPVGHHPQMRARNRRVQIEREAHRVRKSRSPNTISVRAVMVASLGGVKLTSS